MKKYKLIKWYPSLHLIEADFTVEQKVENGDYHPTKKCGRLVFRASEIENNPEFWEEIVEKDYEILQMKNIHGISYSLFENGGLSRYEKENHTIYQIKRLSDGEVFTIGDLVKRPCYKQPFKINHIHIAGDMVWLHSRPFVEGTCTHTLDENTTLREAIKYESPLFTTEDNVDIFEGDKIWGVNEENWKPFYHYATTLNVIEKWKYGKFSTKKAAEEYILLNKPVELSIKEITPIIGRCNETTYVDLDCLTEKLKQLIKSKL